MNTATSGGKAGKIMVVDDTGANLQLLTNLLREQGYTVHPASDGELALEIVLSKRPDLILLDIRMPGMDGFEVCRRLKADERTRDIPIIFISILEDERDKVLGFRAGAVDYITKPFQPEEILARIQTHLRLRELTERLERKVGERTGELTRANLALETEVAERKRAEEDVRLMNERLVLATHAGQVGVWDWDIPKNELVWDNSMYSLYGIQKGDFGGAYDAWASTIHPEDKAHTEGEIQAALRGEREYAPEFRIVQPDGAIRHIKADSQTFRDESGKPLRMIGTNIDISERKRSEEALHLQTVELEEEIAERQMTQESLQEKALLLEEEIEKRQEAQEELERLNESLEERVQERTAELEKKNAELEQMNKIFVGRELRMVELKERIRELEELVTGPAVRTGNVNGDHKND